MSTFYYPAYYTLFRYLSMISSYANESYSNSKIYNVIFSSNINNINNTNNNILIVVLPS